MRSHGEEDAYRKEVLTLPANGKGSGSSWGTMGKLDSLEKPLQRPGGSSNNNNNNNANGDVLTLSKTPERVKRDEWSEGAVTTLLDAYESKWLLRNRAKLKGNDWEDVARHVSTRANGTKSTKTQTQCKNKIESMKKRYRAEAATLNGSNSNANGSSWPLYSRLDGLLRCRTAAAAAGDANPIPCANAIGNPPPDLALLESPTPPPPPPPLPPPPPVEEREGQAEGQGQGQGHGQGQEQGQGQAQAQKQEEVDLVRVAPAAQDSNQADDGSNTLPNRKESAALDTDTSTPRSKIAHAPCDGSGKGVANNYSSKRRKSSGGGGGGGGSSEVAESIRSFADSIVKLEQAKMRLYKDSERLRAETEVRRGEMELKRTEIIAKTQLQIARLLSGKNGKRKLTDRNTITNTSSTTLALTTAPLPPDAAAHAPPPRSLLGK